MSYTLDEVKAQMEEVGIHDLWGTKREGKERTKVVKEEKNEVMKDGCAGLSGGKTGGAICNNYRVLLSTKD